MHTSTDKNKSPKRGSVSKHVLGLMVLGILCFAGVKLFYYFLDNSVADGGDGALLSDSRDRAQQGQHMKVIAGAATGVDKEAIIRRNVFLPRAEQKANDMGSELLASLEPSGLYLVLVGTVIETGGENRAIIFDIEEKKQDLVREGDVIKGASIKQILPGKVVISRQGNNEMLDIGAARELQSKAREMVLPYQQTVEIKQGQTQVQSQGQYEDNSPGEVESTTIDLKEIGTVSEDIIVKGRISVDKNKN
jgi:hypothetical protein